METFLKVLTGLVILGLIYVAGFGVWLYRLDPSGELPGAIIILTATLAMVALVDWRHLIKVKREVEQIMSKKHQETRFGNHGDDTDNFPW